MGRFRQFGKSLKYSLVILLVRIILFSVRLFPWKWTSYVCGQLGFIGFYIVKKERRRTIRNLTIAYGNEKSEAEIRQMAKEVFINLGRSAAELAIKWHIHDKETYFSNVEVVGREHAESAYARGKGIINIVPHLGCWEALAKAYTLQGFSAGAVVRTLKNEKLNEFAVKNREFEGFKVLPRGSTYKAILQFLKQNNSLGMLIDQDTNVKSVFVDFYNKRAYTPIGAAMLALDSDATVFTTSYIRTTGHKYKFIWGKPIDVIRTGDRDEDLRINTERFHQAVEAQIKEFPTQWVWMHNRWKTTPEKVAAKELAKQGSIVDGEMR